MQSRKHATMKATVEWDPIKVRTNRHKHGVTFEEASTVFTDTFSSTIPDPLLSEAEDRFIIIGQSIRRRLLIVVHRDREDVIRIISARVANAREKRTYEEAS